MTKIISAFPACGKTHLFESGGYSCLDSDSSNFSWTLCDKGIHKIRNLDFPNNYIQHIKENIGKVDYIFVSSHIDVQRALDEAGLAWVCVKPDSSLLHEWVGRCWVRGNDKVFIDTLVKNWDNWTKDSWQSNLNPIGNCRLSSGEYLSDKMDFIGGLIGN